MKNTVIIKVIIAIVLIGFFAYIGYLFLRSTNTSSSDLSQNSENSNSKETYTIADVSTHNSSSNCWFVIDNNVYNVTGFINKHPGGAKRITDYCGKDASAAFKNREGQGPHSSLANQMLVDYLIGVIK